MKTKFEKMKRTKKVSRMMLTALVFVLCSTSCSEDTNTNEIETATEDEVAVVEQKTKFITKYFLGDKIQVRLEEDGTYSLAGTDTRLFEEQLSDTDAFNENPDPEESLSALGLGGGVRKWTNSTVVYRIQGLSPTVRSELERSFNEWSSKTNVRFKERTNEPNYVTISSSGSNSNSGVATLGMNGSRGFIRLGTRATAIVIIHEIGHTLGYIHEQNRSDRDDFVRINFDNIQDDAVNQFFKSNSATLVTRQFDVGSTMMYGSFTFSKNGRPTITDLNGNVLAQQQARISSLDVQGTNSIYPASGGATGGEDTNACSSVDNWSPRQRYAVGDRVIYQGRLYERNFTRWDFIKNCG